MISAPLTVILYLLYKLENPVICAAFAFLVDLEQSPECSENLINNLRNLFDSVANAVTARCVNRYCISAFIAYAVIVVVGVSLCRNFFFMYGFTADCALSVL